MAGGEKEVAALASALRLAARQEGRTVVIEEEVTERQCEREFCEQIEAGVKRNEVVLSLACGVGVQKMTQVYPQKVTLPGLNTTFLGQPEEKGIWVENCAGCGDCILHLTGGLCPIARCAKTMLNGPCGGSRNGKCEVGQDIPCVWQEIYDRMVGLGRLDDLLKLEEPKDWRTARDGGPRRRIRQDVAVG